MGLRYGFLIPKQLQHPSQFAFQMLIYVTPAAGKAVKQEVEFLVPDIYLLCDLKQLRFPF